MTTTDLLIHRPVVGCPPHIEEEIPMTIQFGLVGTDGIALVGDRRIYDDSGTTRTTFNGSKFRVNERQTIATAWARKGTGILVARAICKEMTDDCSAPEFALEEIATRVWDGLGLDQKSESHLLVVVSKPTMKLFNIRMTNGGCVVNKVHDRATGGDELNPAVYFVERHYRERPVRELATIAAHAVLLAAKFNSAAINGLEILLCQADGLHQLSMDAASDIEAEIDQFDVELEDLILSRTQQFHYVPYVIG
jgi:hypothetical protein